MKIPRRRTTALAAGLAVTLLLAACGDDSEPTAQAVEPSTTQAESNPTDTGDSTAAGSDQPSGTHDDHDSADAGDAATALRSTMRELWAEHMHWTWSTVVAFATNPDGLEAQLDRLLANQAEIGAAVGSVYGEDAGNQLADLLTVHINQAVPVLQAAQAGDDAALQVALDDWYANAQDIADFLSTANPDNWPEEATRPALKHHIDTTVAYAGDIVGGDYTAAVDHYDEAFDHMMLLADVLTDGIVAAFPGQYAS